MSHSNGSPKTPGISVLLPAYNVSAYVDAAIESICAQTFRDFELILIDDQSTDDTWDHIQAWQAKDARIRASRNPQNLGLIGTLNRGLQLVQAPFMARMDGDDIAHPQRLETLWKMFCETPRLSACGSAIDMIDPAGKHLRTVRFPTDPLVLRYRFLFGMEMAGPTIMYRMDALPPMPVFRPEAQHVEDHDLLLRMLQQNALIANSPVPLYQYRYHEQSVSRQNQSVQYAGARRLTGQYIESLLDAPLADEILAAHFTIRQGESIATASQYLAVGRLEMQLFKTASACFTATEIERKKLHEEAGLRFLDYLSLNLRRHPLASLLPLFRFVCFYPRGIGKLLWRLRHPDSI